MQDVLTRLEALKRPRLLIRTARIGAQDYHRESSLNRLLGPKQSLGHAAALIRLMDLEAEIDTHRREGSAAYAVSQHVDVLIAMMGEARILRSLRVA